MRQSDFVDKLSDFTNSLESLVDLLKAQQKSGPSEVLDQLLENLDGDAIAQISADLAEVKGKVKNIDKNVDKTLEIVKSIKNEKETGLIGDVDDKKNKNSIIQGVKTILLIAAGVLAIGMAFKIVGAVDYFSVVALGMGIVFVAYAFAKVASIKDDKGNPISYKTAIKTAIILVLLSVSILASGLILQLMPTLGPITLLTIVGVGAAMGLASYFLLKGIGNLKTEHLKFVPFLPLMLPAIALGIVGAGFVLTLMPKVTLLQIIHALGVSIALVPIVLAFGFMVKGLKDAKISDILLVGLAIPIMAAGIVLSSYLLQYTKEIPLKEVLIAG